MTGYLWEDNRSGSPASPEVHYQQKERVSPVAQTASHRRLAVATAILFILSWAFLMLAGDRIDWANCVTGFLWRSWLGLYVLPWWLTALRSRQLFSPRRLRP